MWNGNLPLKVKKALTLTGDLKMVFKLQDASLSLNNIWSFFRIWNELLPKNDNLTKVFLLGTFWTITLSVYNLFRNDLIHESMNFGGYICFFFHEKSYQMVDFKMKCLEITTYVKIPMK